VFVIEDASEANKSSSVKHKKHHQKHKRSQSPESVSSNDAASFKDTVSSYEEECIVEEDALYVRGGMGGMVATTDSAMDVAPAIFNDPSVLAVQEGLARVQSVIDEISCWTSGGSGLISELQKTPDTFVRVGRALAEIAQRLSDITPEAAISLKTKFPNVFSLLGSPQFVVIAGVGAVATVVIFGGYRIVKKIMVGANDNLKMANEDMEEEELGKAISDKVFEDRPLCDSVRAPEQEPFKSSHLSKFPTSLQQAKETRCPP
jgi:hypothetical protein